MKTYTKYKLKFPTVTSIIIVFLLLVILPLPIIGQQNVTIYTPQGTPLTAVSNIPEMSSKDKQDWSKWATNNYPLATELNPHSASKKYNCHAYAWHMIHGGSQVWIGYGNPYDDGKIMEDIYWEDGSYIRLNSESGSTKISYYLGNHSAIQTSTTGIYHSKWGEAPLMEHTRAYGPSIYQMNYRRYYVDPKISGDNLVCFSASKTYSVQDFHNVTYTWTVSPNLQIDGSNTGRTVSISAKSSANSAGIITVSIFIPAHNLTRVISKDVWAGPPSYDYISGPMYTPNNQWAFYTAEPNNLLMGAQYLHTWILNPLNGNALYPAGRTVDIAFYNSGDYQLLVQGQNGCGTGPYRATGIHVYDSKSLTITPNPATNEATITIVSTSAEITLDETNEWDLEVYNSQQMLVKKMTRIRSNEYRLQTTGWRTGTYIVRVIYGNEVLNDKLLIVGH